MYNNVYAINSNRLSKIMLYHQDGLAWLNYRKCMSSSPLESISSWVNHNLRELCVVAACFPVAPLLGTAPADLDERVQVSAAVKKNNFHSYYRLII